MARADLFAEECQSWREEEPRIPANVAAVAAKYGIPAEDLDWHVEAEHGWEPHDVGYADAVEAAARCQVIYGRSCRPP